jgi:hypothetical protein
VFGDGQDDDHRRRLGQRLDLGRDGRQDGVLGDDGRIFTSRNGTVETLNGVHVD